MNGIKSEMFKTILTGVSLVLALQVGSARGQETAQTEAHSGDWCATQRMFEASRAAGGDVWSSSACFQESQCDEVAIRDSFIPTGASEFKIVRLYFQVMRNDDGSNAAATAQDVADQMDILNLHCAPFKVQFDYNMRFVNSTAFRNLTSNAEFNQMKLALAVDPAEQLNVYVASVNVNGSVFSFGTFPWDGAALTATGGIVMNRTQFWPFDDGTLTHEVGHNIGLWHTQHGVSEVSQCGACYEQPQSAAGDVTGDFCSDTDPTPTNFSCNGPGGTDPCSGMAWGPTDPQNYMGYAPSSCYTEFSPQQAGRFHCYLENSLSSILLNAQIAIDTDFGEVPLAANFTGSSPRSVNEWRWSFGDGDSAFVQNPSHIYSSPGLYSVGLEISATDGNDYLTVQSDLVYAMAETLIVATASAGPSERVRVDISINNHVPLNSVTIPFTWDGPLFLTLDEVSTVGLRTSDLTVANGGIFEKNNDFGNKRAIRVLVTPLNQPIQPGSGPILTLYFNTPPFQIPGDNPIDIISYGLTDPGLLVTPGVYLPSTVNGSVSMGCCQGAVGNVDGLPGDGVDIADLTFLIDHLFINFPPLDCPAEGNINGDPAGTVDIADLTELIDHLFINFPALPACQ